MESIAVVVPVFNAEDCLEPLSQRLSSVMEDENHDWQLIFVDDQSNDNSLTVLRRIYQSNPAVQIIANAQNMGQHMAVKTGVGQSQCTYTAIMDCDLQDEPEWIPKMVQKLKEEKHDAVMMYWQNYSNGWFRNWLSRLNSAKRKATGKRNNDPRIAVFRVFNEKVKNDFLKNYKSGMLFRDVFDSEKYKLGFIPAKRPPRVCGRSSYSLLKLIKTSLGV